MSEGLVTRREAERLLGYAPGSLKEVMRTHRSRWPQPVATRVRGRVVQYEESAMRAAAAGGTRSRRQRRPAGADADGLVTCLDCGRRFRSLGPHLAQAHHSTAAEYRARHQLPASTALMATDTREVLSDARLNAMAEEPQLVERMRQATPDLAIITALSADSRAATNALPKVRAARRRGWDQFTTRRMVNAARHRHQLAIAVGYTSWWAAIHGTAGLTAHDASVALGFSRTAIKRWRRLYANRAAARRSATDPPRATLASPCIVAGRRAQNPRALTPPTTGGLH